MFASSHRQMLACALALSAGCSAAAGASTPSERTAETERSPVARYLEGRVTVVAGEATWHASRHELGARVADVGANTFRRDVDPAVVRERVTAYRGTVDRDARPGRIDFARRSVRPHLTERRLDVAAAERALLQGLRDGRERIVLPVAETPPDEGVVPEGLRLDAVLAEYRSDYYHHGGGWGRRVNVERATRSVHGAIIPPGGTLSFNERTGPRTYRNGYRRAPVITDGELVPGMGGGVCQVASTLHAAAFYAGLEMEEYRTHSRPSGYVPTGLDATVNWPDGDLVVRNPFDFPIFVSAVADGVHVHVQLLGARAPRRVELRTRLFRRHSFRVRHAENPELAPGVTEIAQRGHGARTVYRTRIIHEGARTWEEHTRLFYPPVPKVIHHGPQPTPAGRPEPEAETEPGQDDGGVAARASTLAAPTLLAAQ